MRKRKWERIVATALLFLPRWCEARGSGFIAATSRVGASAVSPRKTSHTGLIATQPLHHLCASHVPYVPNILHILWGSEKDEADGISGGGVPGEGNTEEIPSDDGDQLIRTLRGGPSLIFAMARRLLTWDASDDVGRAVGGMGTSAEAKDGREDKVSDFSQEVRLIPSDVSPDLPRWRPDGPGQVSNHNPSFRNSSPAMSSTGYAAVIRRNSRKKAQPPLWKHALRTYNRMKTTEDEARNLIAQRDTRAAEAASSAQSPPLRRTNQHHEAALVACAKLGNWEAALRIYEEVEYWEKTNDTGPPSDSVSRSTSATEKVKVSNNGRIRKKQGTNGGDGFVGVTDNMVLSVVRACVRGAKDKSRAQLPIDKRRIPLDRARKVLLSIEERHSIPLVARHVNPIASAYQHLGLTEDARDLIRSKLKDPVAISRRVKRHKRRKNRDDEGASTPTFNVNDVRAKDRSSYAILVKGAVTESDWAGAVGALKEMTESGIYPDARNLNSWAERSERRERSRRRRKKSWKRKRQEDWIRSVACSDPADKDGPHFNS